MKVRKGVERKTCHPELNVVGGLFPMRPWERSTALSELKAMSEGRRGAVKFIIVFFGGVDSAIPRHTDISYICGVDGSVRYQLSRRRFETWMDYRVYHFFPDADFEYGRIGGRTDFDARTLLKMATYIEPRRRKSMVRQARLMYAPKKNDANDIRKRMAFRNNVDKLVGDALNHLNNQAFSSAQKNIL